VPVNPSKTSAHTDIGSVPMNFSVRLNGNI
jgi:hypothetical protein